MADKQALTSTPVRTGGGTPSATTKTATTTPATTTGTTNAVHSAQQAGGNGLAQAALGQTACTTPKTGEPAFDTTAFGLGENDLPTLLSADAQQGIEWDKKDKKANQLSLSNRSFFHPFGGGTPRFHSDAIKLASVHRPELTTGAVEAIDLNGTQESLPATEKQIAACGPDAEGGGATKLTVSRLTGSTVRLPDAGVRAERVAVRGVKLDITSRGAGNTDVTFSADSAAVDGLDGGGAHADHLALGKTAVGYDDGIVSAASTAMDATGVKGGGVEADAVHLGSASLVTGPGGKGRTTDINLPTASATGVNAGGGSARTVSATNAKASLNTGAKGTELTSASVGQVDGTGLRGGSGGTSGSAGAVTAKGISVKPGGKGAAGLTVGADGVTATDVSGSATLDGGGGGGMDPSMMKQVLALVDELHIRDGKIPFKPGAGLDVNGMHGKVDAGSVLTVEVGIEGGKILPKSTSAKVDPGVTFLHLTKLKGVYLTEDGKVRVDLSLFPNFDITKETKAALGMGEKSPLALSSIDPNKLGGGAKGPSPVDALDLGKASAKGDVKLNPGTVQAGNNAVTLAKGTANTDNRGSVDVQPGKKVAVTFTRMLASMFRVNVGGAKVSGGETKASGSSVNIDMGGASTRIRGSVDRVETNGVKGEI